MKTKVAKKLVSSLAVSSALLSAFAACDLGLTPYVAPNDSGVEPVIDTGIVDAGTTVVDSGSDAADGSDGSTGPKIVFVTAASVAGDFNGQHGQAGADTICQNAATAARKSGRFVAWISESNKNAIDHIVDVGPWYLADGRTLVFANKAAITATGPAVAISLTENGTALSVADTGRVWTGTLNNGQYQIGSQPRDVSCTDWAATNNNGITGSATSIGNVWTVQFSDNCTNVNHLYCFQQ